MYGAPAHAAGSRSRNSRRFAGRVLGVEAAVARQVVVPGDVDAVRGEAGGERVDAGDTQARVGLGRGQVAGVDAQVELDASGLEPAAAARGEHRRLGDLGHAERVGVEAAQGVLGPGEGGELDVVDGYEHGWTSW